MPYIRRNAQGLIESVHRQDPGDAELLLDDDPELRSFVGVPADDADFSRLDADFVRVIEDLIDALIARNVINITDLPDQAQAKLFARKSFRESLSRRSLRLFEPTDFGNVI